MEQKEERPQKNMLVMNDKETTFDEADREDLQDPDHDRLVITLFIANHLSKGSLSMEDP